MPVAKFLLKLGGFLLIGFISLNAVSVPAHASLEPLTEAELAQIWAKSSEVDQPPPVPKEQVKRRQSVSSRVVEAMLRNMKKKDVVKIALNKKMLELSRKGAEIAVRFLKILGSN